MTLCELKNLGFEFTIQKYGVYVEYERRFDTYDGWDSIMSEYGEYSDLDTAIEKITSDVVYDIAENRLDLFHLIAQDNHHSSKDWQTYLFLMRIFTQEQYCLKNK